MGSLHVVVVGGGLFGSAAARHAAEAGHRVTVVASPEPADPNLAAVPMASHYDQGRIVRTGGSDPLGAELARRSFQRYGDVARRSGIDVVRLRPLVILTDEPQRQLDVGNAVGADVHLIDAEELTARAGIAVPTGFEGGVVMETSTAGIVNPRLLVRAQLKLAHQAGARVVASHVVDLNVATDQVLVQLADSGQCTADQLILATGAYGTELLGPDQPTSTAAIQRRLRTVALIAVDGPTDSLPSLSAGGFLHPSSTDAKLEETYWVPPVRYPDGGVYLKIGGNSLPMRTADSNADIGRWFQDGGSADEADALFALACDLLPTRSLRLAAFKPCVVSYTDDEQPIVARFDERVVLALAGNGSGATIGDEVGRRAAALAVSGSPG